MVELLMELLKVLTEIVKLAAAIIGLSKARSTRPKRKKSHRR